MESLWVARTVVGGWIVGSIVWIGRGQEVVSLVDLVVIACGSIVLNWSVIRFLRAPGQFLRAVGERILYVLGTPFLVLVRLMAVIVSIALTLAKIWLGFVIWAIYFFSPIDILPELLLGCFGYADDVVFGPAAFGLSFFVTKFITFRVVIPDLLDSATEAIEPATEFP